MKEMWLIFAILSAVFAAATSILAKIGIEGVDSNLATAIRTIVVLLMAWGMVFLTHNQVGISEISTNDTVLIIGAGPTGICTLLCSMLKHPKCIIVCEQIAEAYELFGQKRDGFIKVAIIN